MQKTLTIRQGGAGLAVGACVALLFHAIPKPMSDEIALWTCIPVLIFVISLVIFQPVTGRFQSQPIAGLLLTASGLLLGFRWLLPSGAAPDWAHGVILLAVCAVLFGWAKWAQRQAWSQGVLVGEDAADGKRRLWSGMVFWLLVLSWGYAVMPAEQQKSMARDFVQYGPAFLIGVFLVTIFSARAMQKIKSTYDSKADKRSVENRLDELERLNRREMVTPEEYAAKRQEILNDL
jgi:hypothetical protein